MEVSGQLDLFSLLGLGSSLETRIDRRSNSGGAYGFSAHPGGNRNNKNNARSVRCLQDSGKFNISRLKNDLRFAYFQARKHKRNTHSICFINEKPVKREIIAANFRDRVGKGTDFGINRDILYQLIVEGLCKARWRSVPDRDLCLFLIRSFVFNDPLQGARFRSPRSAWKSDSIKFKSGCYAEISPFEILNVKSYFKKESQQSLDKKAREFDRLETEEKMYERMVKIAEET